MRDYHMPDADMMQKSRTKRQHFINNKPAFVAFDADFDDPFVADWLASIEASESTESAETRDDGSQQETAEVLAVMALANKKRAEMKYFIEKAHGHQPNIMNKLGLDDFDDSRASQQKMALSLRNLHDLANS